MHFYLRKTDRRTQSRHVIAADRWVPKLGKGRKISMHPSAIIRSRQVMAPRPSRIIPSWTVRVTQRTWGLVDTTVCLGAVQNEKTENFLPPPTHWNRATIVQPLSCYLHPEVSVLPEHFQTQKKSIENLYSVCKPPHVSAKHGYHQALHKFKCIEKNAIQWKLVHKI